LEQTSGIDYFNSFDLNHIVFAIHGKKADSPSPGGSYKADMNSKDVNIQATSTIPQEKKSLSFSVLPFQIPSSKKNTYTLKITVTNSGNTYLWNYPISITQMVFNFQLIL
jgi:hypothetical protein